MADPLNVELVAADRKVWTGEATMVIAKTCDGDIGVLPNHAPVLGVLLPGAVQVHQVGGEVVVAAVYGGFLSVANNEVVILAEEADLASEIDVEAAQQELDRSAHSEDEDALAASQRARAQIRAHGLAF